MPANSSSNPTVKLRDALSSRILDGISMPVVVVDNDSKIRVFNKRAGKLVGKQEEELYNTDLEKAHEAYAQVVMEGVIETAFNRSEASVVEGIAFETLEGESVIYNFQVDPLIDSKDRVYAVTITGVDVSEVHRVKSQLGRQNEQLQAMYQASNALRSSFDLRKSLFIIGTALTSVQNAIFDHALVFLVENENELHGTFATEKFRPDEVADVWARMDSESSFKRFLKADYPVMFDRVRKLSKVLRRIKVSLFKRNLFLTEVAAQRCTLSHHEVPDCGLSSQLKRVFGDRAYIATPLLSEGKLLGVLMVACEDPATTFEPEVVQMLEMMAAQAAVAISSSIAYQRINDRAQRDSLTGLYNHGYLMSRVHEETARARRYGENFGFLMIDIDHFKQLNDKYLHQTGDEVLLRLSELLQNTARESDICARYGGEEFSVILPGANLEETEAFAERLRVKIEKAELAHDSDQKPIRVTVSIGVSGFPEHGGDEHEIIARADTALYSAKRGGRNRVAVAD